MPHQQWQYCRVNMRKATIEIIRTEKKTAPPGRIERHGETVVLESIHQAVGVELAVHHGRIEIPLGNKGAKSDLGRLHACTLRHRRWAGAWNAAVLIVPNIEWSRAKAQSSWSGAGKTTMRPRLAGC